MATYLVLACGIGAIVYLVYYYLTYTFSFWKERGVAGPKPIPFFGTIKDVIFGKMGLGNYAKMLYDKNKGEPMIGIFTSREPTLILTDLDVIKNVLIKDFSSFADRGIVYSSEVEPLLVNLINLEPERWRPLRKALSPIFTSGKLKEMFGMILDCSKNLEKSVAAYAETGEPVDIRELAGKFTIDVIGRCAFGLDAKALTEEDSNFERMGKKIFEPTFKAALRILLQEHLPAALYHLTGSYFAEPELTDFFTSITTQTMEYRRKHNIRRTDFISALMDLQDYPEKLGDIKLTPKLMAAQAFVFFSAGFETSATAATHALYELALNQDVQAKLRKEIQETYKANDGKMDYETINEMEYLDAVFRETLRKYPAVMNLRRRASNSYTFEGTDITIPKGQIVIVPIYAIQRDPSIYPNPDVFDPDRFRNGADATRHPMSFLAFGDGPRICIGSRFAVYQTKIALIKILHNHNVNICEKTPIPYVNNPKTFLMEPTEKIYLKITKAIEA